MPKAVPKTPDEIAMDRRIRADMVRERAVKRKLERRLKKVLSELLDVVQIALAESVVFAEDYMHLQWATFYLARSMDAWFHTSPELLAPAYDLSRFFELPPDVAQQHERAEAASVSKRRRTRT